MHVNMARLRLQFPFLWKDRVEGRAKRSLRDQPRPLLLSSYRAHLRCISCMAYIDEMRLVLRYHHRHRTLFSSMSNCWNVFELSIYAWSQSSSLACFDVNGPIPSYPRIELTL